MDGDATSAEMIKDLYSPATKRLADPETSIEHLDTTHDHYGHGRYGIVYAFTPSRESVIYTGGATAQDYARDFRLLLE